MSLKSTIRSRLPASWLPRLRAGRGRLRSLRYRLRQRAKPVTVTREDIVASLREVGLREGDGVFLHASLSAFGEIEGGSQTVIDALDEVVGAEGLVAMPAFPLVGGTAEYLSTDPVFDVRETPSRMGALTERFRTSPGVVRSLHPTHSVAARGPGAEELVAGHDLAETPFGAGTPFARMIDRGMVQLWFGIGLRIFTLYHAFECLRPDGFPIEVFATERVDARVVDEDGRERTVSTLVHDPVVGGRKDDTRAAIKEHLLATGVLRETTLGRGEVMAARMPELMDELETLLQRGVTIYLIPVPSTAER
ncbi:MAG TPA: AAC(3) family N-acetyltransferase [Gaiellaceae bacterium]